MYIEMKKISCLKKKPTDPEFELGALDWNTSANHETLLQGGKLQSTSGFETKTMSNTAAGVCGNF